MSEKYIGTVEYYDNTVIKGWALNKNFPDSPARVKVLSDGMEMSTITPLGFRWDLKKMGYGRGYHGFIFRIPPEWLDSRERRVRLVFEDTGETLENGELTFNDSPESRYTPVRTTDLTGSAALVIAPHPDDETYGCGGALHLHVKAGDPVKVIFLTDGSRGDFTGRYPKEEYVALREQEALKACDILGTSDLEFWRNPDRAMSADGANIDRLAEVLNTMKPGIIYVPSPFEFHEDHRAASELVWRAVQKTGTDCRILFYEVNTAIRINALVDISDVTDVKIAAGDVYESQLDNIPYTDFSLALNRFRALTVHSTSTHAEGFFIIDGKEARKHPIEKFAAEQFFSVFDRQTEDPPLVSVIVRTKDRPHLLKEALSSILTQTYPRVEAIVVNDGGKDVRDVVYEFRDYLDVRYIHFSEPRGRTAAGNEGIKKANGEYVNFLDDDDVFYKDHVSKLAMYMFRTGAGAAYSDCEIGRYDWTGKELVLKGEKTFFRGVDHDLDQLYVFNYIPNMTMMFRKSILDESGYPDEELEIYEDWDLFLKLSMHTDPVRLPGVTAEYRILSERSYDHNKWRLRIYEKYKDYFETDDLETWFISRTDNLYEEIRYLRRLLAENSVDVNENAIDLPAHDYYVWKIKSALKKFLPVYITNVLKRLKSGLGK